MLKIQLVKKINKWDGCVLLQANSYHSTKVIIYNVFSEKEEFSFDMNSKISKQHYSSQTETYSCTTTSKTTALSENTKVTVSLSIIAT
jgi:hypothetical protein